MRRPWTVGVLGIVAGIAVSLALMGCVATVVAMPARGVIVSGPPPPPIVEVREQAAPHPGAVWVVGYWHWTGMQYAWIPGHWENAPPGTAWAAPRYVRTDGAYVYEAGGWRPAPPATANALR